MPLLKVQAASHINPVLRLCDGFEDVSVDMQEPSKLITHAAWRLNSNGLPCCPAQPTADGSLLPVQGAMQYHSKLTPSPRNPLLSAPSLPLLCCLNNNPNSEAHAPPLQHMGLVTSASPGSVRMNAHAVTSLLPRGTSLNSLVSKDKTCHWGSLLTLMTLL